MPVTAAAVMVKVAAPVDVSVSVRTAVTLTGTFPKGTLAELASAYGEIDLTSVLDEEGNPLDLFPEMAGPVQTRLGDEKTITTTLSFSPSRPLRKIRELRGTMALHTSDQSNIVIIKDLLTKIKAAPRIDAPSLRASRVTVRVNPPNKAELKMGGFPFAPIKTLDIALTWQRDAVVRCEVLDGDGRPLRGDDVCTSWDGDRSVSWKCTFSSIPSNAELRLTVQKNGRKIRVPFVLKNIEVPPMPDE